MNQAQYNQLFSFIWNIANDVLVQVFTKGDYKKIILPMIVLRRLDILLEPTHTEVLKQSLQKLLSPHLFYIKDYANDWKKLYSLSLSAVLDLFQGLQVGFRNVLGSIFAFVPKDKDFLRYMPESV